MAQKCRYGCKNGKVYMEAFRGFVDCPDCKSIVKVIQETPEEADLLNKLKIPDGYKNAGVAGVELFPPSETSQFSTTSVNDVVSMLERMNKDVYSGKVTRLSTYFYVGNQVDIRAFVYGIQKLGLERGIGVSPFVSLNTLAGIQKTQEYDIDSANVKENGISNASGDFLIALEGKRFIEDTGLTYYDFKHADLCFLEATASTTNTGWTILADLLAERARNGLPTYVVGYWASYSAAKTSPLGFLLSKGLPRLDKLVPYELKSQHKGKGSVEISMLGDPGTTQSDIKAGVRID